MAGAHGRIITAGTGIAVAVDDPRRAGRHYRERFVGATAVTALQRSAGNAAVTALMTRKREMSAELPAVLQRVIAPSDTPARQPAPGRDGLVAKNQPTQVLPRPATTPSLQRAPGTPAAASTPPMSQAEAEAWYREMNIDDAFTDPAPPAVGDQPLAGQALEEAIEDSLHQSLTPEEMHRQLLFRRAQPLAATAYQAADPTAVLADLQRRIRNIQARVRTREAKILALKKAGKSAKGQIDVLKAEIGAYSDEVKVLKKARNALPDASRFSRFGRGAPAGTGAITYAGIQVQTADGRRIALEFAETNATEHAEQAMIRQIEANVSTEQLRGSRVVVVGDQVVCGERCVPALTDFARRNDVASVDGIVFRRRQLTPPPAEFIGPQELASPRTSLRTMTESKSAGTELIKQEIPVYRRPGVPPADPGGAAALRAESSVEHAVTTASIATSTEAEGISAIKAVAAKEPAGFWSNVAKDLVADIKSITPAKAAKFGTTLAVEAVKGYITARIVDYVVGDSRLEDDLAALDAANHTPHNDLPERIRRYEKEALSLLPPQLAIGVSGALRSINFMSPDFLYEATTQEQRRRYEEFKAQYGDSEDAARAYDNSLKAEEDFYNGDWP